MHEKLHAHMQECGLPASHVDLNLDGTLHRYGKEGSHDDKDEWYIGYELDNGEIYCTFGTWSNEQDKFTYKSWKDNNPQNDKYLEQAKILREKHLEQERKQAKQALEFTQNVWAKAPLSADDHPYLKRKKVKAHGIKTYQGKLVIPRYDSTGKLASVQTIDEKGLKKNAAGLPCKSTYLILGEREKPDTIRFCEGYATAATIYEQTGDMTVACFSCGNIFGSTFLVREKYPNANLVLNADKNTEKVCEKWKKQYGGEVQVPQDCDGTDFNDLFIEKGEKVFKSQTFIDEIKGYPLGEFLDERYPPRVQIMYSMKRGEKQNILVQGTSTLLFSAGGVGKTMFLFEAAIAMAYAQNFLFWHIDKPWKIFYVDTEMDAMTAQERFSEIIIRRGVAEENFNLSYYNQSAEDMRTGKRRAINLYSQHSRNLLSKSIEKSDIVIIDNLQNATRDYENEGKENSSSSWCMIHDWMKHWQSMGKTFIIAHHENRSGTYRGTSRLDGDFDNIIHLTRPEDPPEEGFQFIYEIQKGRSIPQFLQHKKTSAHQLPTWDKCYGWKLEDLPKK